ncbi:MAG: DNA-binding protein [Alphaproteobacteria bacterium]|nr:DNA-binding protein [Alphaproteobacteria bacterium]
MTGGDQPGVTVGKFARVLSVRVRPNIDLIESVEKICADHGIRHAEVRSAVGSLTDATLRLPSGEQRTIIGPGLEIALTSGRVAPDDVGAIQARVYGLVSDSAGHPHGGEFVRGANPVFVTLELVLQEWLPEGA